MSIFKNIKAFFYLFPALIAFLLPFGNALTSPVIALWFVSGLISAKDLFQKEALKSRWFWIIVSFFILTLLSNFLFYNASDSFNAIEIKLSFLFLPVLFFLFKMELAIARRIIASFVSGCFIACLFLLGRSFFYLLNGDDSYLYYSKFSYFMHSAYFAMYLNLAIVFILFFYFKWFEQHALYKRMAFLMLGILALCVVLCASKIGILTLFFILPLFLVWEYKNRINLKTAGIALAALLVLSTSVYLFIPQVFDRLKSVSVVSKSSIDKTSTESSSVRVLIWGECKELIKENFITGVGVANANDALYKAYETHGLTGAFEKKLNAHNQFYQSFIGMGVLGFFNLLLITVGVLVFGFREKNVLLSFFAVLITVNFLVESMLQTSAGNVFYVFFLCLLLVFRQKSLAHDKA
jgi:O-antigen ligase